MTATDDGAALLRAILANPACDTARLVYADWLDEQGGHERAEFIRVQVELAKAGVLKPHRHARGCELYGLYRNPVKRFFTEMATCPKCRHRRQVARQGELLRAAGDWFPAPGDLMSRRAPSGTRIYWGHPSQDDSEAIRGEIARGFVGQITCTAADWLAHADDVLAAHPVTRVALTGRVAWGTYENRDGSRTEVRTPAEFQAWAEAYWPGVAFELPVMVRTLIEQGVPYPPPASQYSHWAPPASNWPLSGPPVPPPPEPWPGYSGQLAAAMNAAGLHETPPVTQAQWGNLLNGSMGDALADDPPG